MAGCGDSSSDSENNAAQQETAAAQEETTEKAEAVHTGPLSVQLIIVDRSGKEHASDLAVYSLE